MNPGDEARFNRAVRAACDKVTWHDSYGMKDCIFPECQDGDGICWIGELQIPAFHAFAEAWEAPQTLETTTRRR